MDVTNASVIALVEYRDGAECPEPYVLLEWRDDGVFAPGHWVYPGGRLEEGESPTMGMIREAKEELGIEPTDISYLGRLRTNEAWTVDAFMVCCWQGNMQHPQRTDAGHMLRWHRLDTVIRELTSWPPALEISKWVEARLNDEKEHTLSELSKLAQLLANRTEAARKGTASRAAKERAINTHVLTVYQETEGHMAFEVVRAAACSEPEAIRHEDEYLAQMALYREAEADIEHWYAERNERVAKEARASTDAIQASVKESTDLVRKANEMMATLGEMIEQITTMVTRIESVTAPRPHYAQSRPDGLQHR